MKILKNGLPHWTRLFVGDRKGVTALEYGLIAALIAGVIVTAVTNLGSTVSSTFVNLNSSMASSKPA